MITLFVGDSVWAWHVWDNAWKPCEIRCIDDGRHPYGDKGMLPYGIMFVGGGQAWRSREELMTAEEHAAYTLAL